MDTGLFNLTGLKKNLKKVLVVWKTLFTFAIPNRERREAQENRIRFIRMTFGLEKKNFKKVLVDWKKIFTFAHANQGQQ